MKGGAACAAQADLWDRAEWIVGIPSAGLQGNEGSMAEESNILEDIQ